MYTYYDWNPKKYLMQMAETSIAEEMGKRKTLIVQKKKCHNTSWNITSKNINSSLASFFLNDVAT